MFSAWIYFAAASAIAALAFVLGQLMPAVEVPFVILATTAWTARAATRQRQLDRLS